LRTLTVIGDTLENIKKNRGQSINLDDLPLDDQKSAVMLSAGDTAGVFQLESSGMVNLIKELKPTCFEDLIPLVALYRPGPLGSGMVEDFIKGRHGKKKVQYMHPLLEPILKDTFGVILYQEQVMQIASVMAGFSLGQADLLRRAMGKKKPEVIAAQRETFLAGAAERSIDRKVAGEIFDLMAHFADYGFNKSHSAAYAVVAYQTAYLKANYPQEFMAALLTSVMATNEKIAFYIDQCRRMGIKILPPDVNASGTNFTVVEQDVRFGLAAVKNVGKAAIDIIVEAREAGGPFTSFFDFCRRVDPRIINKRIMESLIKCGAFDTLAGRRSQLLAVLEQAVDYAQAAHREKMSGQTALFGSGETEIATVLPLPDIPELPVAQALAHEKEMLGFYITGHPLNEYAELVKRYTTAIADLGQVTEGRKATIAGVVTGLRKTVTKTGDTMAFVQLEDLIETVEVVVFARVYQEASFLLASDQPLFITGRINHQDDAVKIIAETIKTAQEYREIKQGMTNVTPQEVPVAEPVRYERLFIKIMQETSGAEMIETLQQTLLAYPGGLPVQLCDVSKKENMVWPIKFNVAADEGLVRKIEELLGSGTARFR
jgi:DNA polymerase-3 subunit alpha